MSTLAPVRTCTVTSCSYNKDGCTAEAVTIAGEPKAAACITFVELDARGGLPTASGHVGACQRLECVHNTDLLCTAEGIDVGASVNKADCLTYQPR